MQTADPSCSFAQHLRSTLRKDNFVIVQLGANVGNSLSDPLYTPLLEWHRAPHSNSGIILLVEPSPFHFPLLVDNYRGINEIVFENCAVADHNGHRTLYYLDLDPVAHGFPEWMGGLNSIRHDRMTDLWDRYEASHSQMHSAFQKFYLLNRKITTVPCYTLSALFDKHNITSCDILQIDVEGLEYEVLSAIDYGRCRPYIIHYEHVLLFERQAPLESLLAQNGYSLQRSHQDTIATLL